MKSVASDLRTYGLTLDRIRNHVGPSVDSQVWVCVTDRVRDQENRICGPLLDLLVRFKKETNLWSG